MQFYFIRHAQSTNNLLYDTTGSSNGRSHDPALSSAGLRQAVLLGEFLRRGNPAGGCFSLGDDPAGFGLTHLYTSLMVRAVMTGAQIAQALGLPLIAWYDLHEEGGIYLEDEKTGERIGQAGNDLGFFQHQFPELKLPAGFIESGWWNYKPFEQPAEALQRARHFLNDLLERHGDSDDRVAVVSHGAFYNYIMTALLGLADGSQFWFRMNNAAITRIDLVDEQIKVFYQNRMDFLPQELIT